jgi:hypothetical protein
LGGFGHRTGDEDNSITGYRQLELFLHNSFAKADGRPAFGWSAQDCMPIDGLPYVGVIDSHARLYAATGYAKWGMTNATAAAIMIADSIAGTGMIAKEVRDVFSPGRVAPAASAKGFFAQTGHTIKAFTADNITIPNGSYVAIGVAYQRQSTGGLS